MRVLAFAAVAMGGLASGDVLAFGCTNSAMISTTRDDGTRIGIVLPDDAAARTPEWESADSEPPLALSRAMALSLEWAQKAYSRFDSVEISEISLRRLPCSRNRDRWFYLVDFNPMIAGNRMYGTGNWAAVLMDGSVVGTQTLD